MMHLTVKLDPQTVAEIVQNHLNKSLSANKRASVSTIYGSSTGVADPNTPNHELSVTFKIIDTEAT